MSEKFTSKLELLDCMYCSSRSSCQLCMGLRCAPNIVRFLLGCHDLVVFGKIFTNWETLPFIEVLIALTR